MNKIRHPQTRFDRLKIKRKKYDEEQEKLRQADHIRKLAKEEARDAETEHELLQYRKRGSLDE